MSAVLHERSSPKSPSCTVNGLMSHINLKAVVKATTGELKASFATFRRSWELAELELALLLLIIVLTILSEVGDLLHHIDHLLHLLLGDSEHVIVFPCMWCVRSGGASCVFWVDENRVLGKPRRLPSPTARAERSGDGTPPCGVSTRGHPYSQLHTLTLAASPTLNRTYP